MRPPGGSISFPWAAPVHRVGPAPVPIGIAPVLVVCNFTPLPRTNYALGVPFGGFWRERLNSDAHDYGGAGWGNMGGVDAAPVPAHGHAWSISVTLPPLSTVMLQGDPDA